MAFNKVILNGRLTKDPELKIFGEKSVLNFDLAVRRSKETTDFIPCVAFGDNAKNIATYFHKGDGILIEGALRIDSYEKEGKTQLKTYVACNSFVFPEGQKNNER